MALAARLRFVSDWIVCLLLSNQEGWPTRLLPLQKTIGLGGRHPVPRPFGWRCMMSDPKGDLLYVDLPASQVKRRLKGFGHGVRKVQSAGKGRAVVIHTATGQHLDELKAVLGELKVGASEDELDRLAHLRRARRNCLE